MRNGIVRMLGVSRNEKPIQAALRHNIHGRKNGGRMLFVIEFVTKASITIDASSLGEAERSAKTYEDHMNGSRAHGEVTTASVLGRAETVEARDTHIKECKGCCGGCGGHCPKFDGRECGA
jgi:hypothetical protein